MIGVRTEDQAFREAVAALPLQAVADGAAGARVLALRVGAGWLDRIHAAVDAGTTAVVVCAAARVDAVELAALRDLAADASLTVVTDRPLLRADLVAQALATAPDGASTVRYRTAEVVAAPDDLPVALRDAVGWLGRLASAPVTVTEVTHTTTGILARLRSPGSDAPSLLTATGIPNASGRRVRIHSIGASRTEIVIDEPAALRAVTVRTADGDRRLPRLHESSERVALRRVLTAVRDGAAVDDLARLADDHRTAQALLADHSR